MSELTIWKFPIPVTGEYEHEFDIELPEEFRVLTVQVQKGHGVCLWAVVNPEAKKIKQGFVLRGTGVKFVGDLRYAETNPMPQYIGTFQTDDGMFVWHLFAKKRRPA